MRHVFLSLILMTVNVQASDQNYYNEGKKDASEGINFPKTDLLNDFPGADGKSASPQKYASDPAALQAEAARVYKGGNANSSKPEEQAAGSFKELNNTKQQFKFGEKDEILTLGDDLVKNALDKMGVVEEAMEAAPAKEEVSQHTCEESREETSYNCTLQRHVTINQPKPKTHRFNIHVFTEGHGDVFNKDLSTNQALAREDDKARITINNPLPLNSCQTIQSAKLIFPPAPIVSADKKHWVVIMKQNRDLGKWKGNITRIESLVSISNQGILTVSPKTTYKKKNHTFRKSTYTPEYSSLNDDIIVEITYAPVVSEADITETIEDTCGAFEDNSDKGICSYGVEKILERGPKTFSPLTITRDWWKKERNYLCSHPSKNNCGDLRTRGCSQTKSVCKTSIGDTCVVYTQTYECKSSRGVVKISTLKGKTPFCLDANCDEHSWAPNQDFAEAASRLTIFREMQGQYSKKNPSVFRGVGQLCRKNCAGFRDCCGKGKGWGSTFGATCSGDEKALAEQRQANRCVAVGTFCAKKILGQCVEKKSSFCCFPSKLVRAVQEQGRKQLGINWGTPSNPDCRGFTIEELQKIDFSKIDLSETFDEIRANTSIPDTNKLTSELKDSLSSKARNFQPTVRDGPNLTPEQRKELDEKNM